MQKPALCAVALALGACVPDIDEMASEARRRKDAAIATVDGTATPPTGTSTTPNGTVSCYTEGAPANTCTLPTHCCFSNYSAQHNGYCSTTTCEYGTIDCDGPEDCAAGQRCCSHAIIDPTNGLVGYRVACQATACGSPTQHEELCHPTGPACDGGRACVTAYGTNNDLPRSLYLCR